MKPNRNRKDLVLPIPKLFLDYIFSIFQASQSSPRRVAVPVLVKDGKPCSAGSGNSGVLGGVGGGVGVGAGGLHDVSGGGHHDHSDVGGMSNLLDVGLTGHHPSTGHHFHHGMSQ